MEVVREITQYQGKYTAEVIKSGALESVIWPHLGKVIAPPDRVQRISERMGNKKK